MTEREAAEKKYPEGRFTLHCCQSVEGALRNWGKSEWNHIARENGITVNQAKERFRIMEFEGKKVIPFGEPCEGFSYETGCPGHPVLEGK